MNVEEKSPRFRRWFLVLVFASFAVGLWLVSRPSTTIRPGASAGSRNAVESSAKETIRASRMADDSFPRLRRTGGPPESAEEIVAAKLTELATRRKALVARLAARRGKEVPADVSRFFEALERGDWAAADRIFEELRARKDSEPESELWALWTPVREAQGIQREARNWPPEQFIAYAQKMLGALRPDQVFIGGTDPGCFINTLFNETSGGPQHILFTQNALADSSYIEYLKSVYGERLNFPTEADQQAAFAEYMQDAQARLEHDRNFPDEPRQLRPGENVTFDDQGRIQVSGEIAVMSINERILGKLLEQNPDVSFALEESFSLKSTYVNAAPLGPVLELRAGEESRLTPERAAETVANWRVQEEELVASTTSTDEYPRRAWAHAAAAQGNLLLEHNYLAEAEETYRTALRINPASPEARAGLAQLDQLRAPRE